MKWIKILSIVPVSIGCLCYLSSCTSDTEPVDAYGTFETTETLVVARGNGMLINFNVEEGQRVTAGKVVGDIDTTDLHIKAAEVEAGIRALRAGLPKSAAQLQVIDQQLRHARREQTRIAGLLQGQAATEQQKDNIDAEISLLEKKYNALQANLSVETAAILGKISPLSWQLKQIAVDIDRCKITSPVSGVVLTKFAEPGETVHYDKPLFTVGNLDRMILRAYLTADQLNAVALGDSVQVLTDRTGGGYTHWNGIISWIADKAEFTPTQIQTRDQRADLVYAVKIRVANKAGELKIGMPGEVVFKADAIRSK